MGRKKKKPDYDPDKIMNTLLQELVEAYATDPLISLRTLAEEFSLNPIKVRKLLITAGVYESEIAETVFSLWQQGRSVTEIMAELQMSKASVNSYLPYSKVVYKAEEISTVAERVRLFRERRAAVEKLQVNPSEEQLWETMKVFAKYPFYTAERQKFAYVVKGNEIVIDQSAKVITREEVESVYCRMLAGVGAEVGQENLGDTGVQFLYPVFLRFGVLS